MHGPALHPSQPPPSPRWPAQVRWGQANGSEGPTGAAKPGRFFRRGGPGPGNGPRAPPQPPLVQDRIFEDWSGQGWGSRASSPGAFGMQWKESSQALEGRGGTSRLWRRFPALSRAASSPGVLFRQGASPSFHRGQAPRTRAPKGTAEHPTTQTQSRNLARPCSALGSQQHGGNLTLGLHLVPLW